MACKLQIETNIRNVVQEKTEHVLHTPLAIAQSIAMEVNTEFGADVVNFTQGSISEDIVRTINIPQELVDEYYNNELAMDRASAQRALESSPAAKETLALVESAAKKMGINIQDLEDYLKGNPEVDIQGLTGIADLTKKNIAVAQDRADTTLTEEVVHMATSMLEQTDPKFVTGLISKIDRFKIYKTVLDQYKNLKAYQLSNGKLDIRKIKKEAVDKLISEVIIYQSEGSTEFPE